MTSNMNAAFLLLLFFVTIKAAYTSTAHQKNSKDTPVVSANPSPTAQSIVEGTPAPKVEAIPISVAGIPNFHHVEGTIYRSGRVPAVIFPNLKKAGFASVLSLEQHTIDRDDAEEERVAVDAAGLKFHYVPMNGLLKPKLAAVYKALDYMLDPANQPILVHCHHGSDRTGIVLAAYRIKYSHWSMEQAVAEMYRYGHSKYLKGWDSLLQELQ